MALPAYLAAIGRGAWLPRSEQVSPDSGVPFAPLARVAICHDLGGPGGAFVTAGRLADGTAPRGRCWPFLAGIWLCVSVRAW